MAECCAVPGLPAQSGDAAAGQQQHLEDRDAQHAAGGSLVRSGGRAAEQLWLQPQLQVWQRKVGLVWTASSTGHVGHHLSSLTSCCPQPGGGLAQQLARVQLRCHTRYRRRAADQASMAKREAGTSWQILWL